MSWIATSIGVTGVGAGLSAYSASTKKTKTNSTQLPEYPESEASRQMWWQKLAAWGEDPNYGAVTPDWDNIWNMTQRKINDYYSGTALKTGVKDKLKSSMARRNIQDSPAYDYLSLGLDVEQGNQLKDAAVQEGVQKTNLAESGRQNWLGSLERLSSMKPQFIQSTSQTGGVPWMDILGAGMQAGGKAGLISSIGGDMPTETPSGMVNYKGQNYSASPSWLDTTKWKAAS